VCARLLSPDGNVDNQQVLSGTVMADRSARSLSQSVDDGVYALLISSDRNTYVQTILIGTDYESIGSNSSNCVSP
jgi:hypothetical protein